MICSKNINEISSFWEQGTTAMDPQLQLSTITSFTAHHNGFFHLFIANDFLRIYASIVPLNIEKTIPYLSKKAFISIVLKKLSPNVLYLTNPFLTNLKSYSSKNNFAIEDVLSAVNEPYGLLIIPEFFEEKVSFDNTYVKIEVEPEMHLKIQPYWHSIETYKNDLKRKYRLKINAIEKKTKTIDIRLLNHDQLIEKNTVLQQLFDQVFDVAKFSGPKLNTAVLMDLVKIKYLKVYGFFYEGKMIGFSSFFEQNDDLYSYYVGFDKTINKSIPIYGRMILFSIEQAILLKKKVLYFGRTASEYKSNFGSVPVKSYVYVKFKNRLLNRFFQPYIKNIQPHSWIQRRPFKKA